MSDAVDKFMEQWRDEANFNEAWAVAKEIIKHDPVTAMALVTMIAGLVMRVIIPDDRFESAVDVHTKILLMSPPIDDEELAVLRGGSVSEQTH